MAPHRAVGVLKPAALRNKPDLAQALAPDRLVPLGGVIGALSRQEASDLKTPLEARAICGHVTTTLRYDKSGKGWIPVDSSEAWKNPDKRDYFFGAHDVHRIMFTVGHNILLTPRKMATR